MRVCVVRVSEPSDVVSERVRDEGKERQRRRGKQNKKRTSDISPSFPSTHPAHHDPPPQYLQQKIGAVERPRGGDPWRGEDGVVAEGDEQGGEEEVAGGGKGILAWCEDP